MNAQQPSLGFIAAGPADSLETGGARAHNEEAMIGAYRILRLRVWWLIAAIVLALILATAYVLLAPKRYTAEALLRMDFEAERSEGAPRVSLDPAAVVESEARIMRSRVLAERVVAARGLEDNPEFSASPGLVGKLLSALRELVAPASAPEEQPGSPADRPEFKNAVSALMSRISVENDNKSYLVTVKARAGSAQTAADVANAVAEQYLRGRELESLIEARAKADAEMARLSQRIGERHPTFIAARTRREQLDAQIDSVSRAVAPVRTASVGSFTAYVAAPALAPLAPSSPKPAVIYGLALAGALGAAALLALLWERQRPRLFTERAIWPTLGVRCFGVVPGISPASEACSRAMMVEAVRAIGVAAGLDVSRAGGTVVLVGSSLPDEGKTQFATTLSSVLSESGSRVLFIDTIAQLGRYISQPKAGSHLDLPSVPATPYHTATFDDRTLMIWGQGFEELLNNARKTHDIIIIKAPPALLLPDAIRIARLCDVVLLLARWRKTPASAVANAIRKMREAGTRVTGLVLTDVDLRRSRIASPGSHDDYLSKYRRFYASLAS